MKKFFLLTAVFMLATPTAFATGTDWFWQTGPECNPINPNTPVPSTCNKPR